MVNQKNKDACVSTPKRQTKKKKKDQNFFTLYCLIEKK